MFLGPQVELLRKLERGNKLEEGEGDDVDRQSDSSLSSVSFHNGSLSKSQWFMLLFFQFILCLVALENI